MPIPTIFTWPTPWLWLGLTMFLVGVIGDAPALTIAALVILAASVVHMARGMAGRSSAGGRRADQGSGEPQGLDRRLSEIERRLTDTQDVMIALSEKMDRWEREGLSRVPDAASTGRGRE